MPLPARAFRCARDAVRGIARVQGDEPQSLRHRHEEVGVYHSQWQGDTPTNELVQREAGRAFDDAAENVRVVAVHPRLARLPRERHGCECLHGGAHRLVLVRRVPTVTGGRPEALRRVQRRDE